MPRWSDKVVAVPPNGADLVGRPGRGAECRSTTGPTPRPGHNSPFPPRRACRVSRPRDQAAHRGQSVGHERLSWGERIGDRAVHPARWRACVARRGGSAAAFAPRALRTRVEADGPDRGDTAVADDAVWSRGPPVRPSRPSSTDKGVLALSTPASRRCGRGESGRTRSARADKVASPRVGWRTAARPDKVLRPGAAPNDYRKAQAAAGTGRCRTWRPTSITASVHRARQSSGNSSRVRRTSP